MPISIIMHYSIFIFAMQQFRIGRERMNHLKKHGFPKNAGRATGTQGRIPARTAGRIYAYMHNLHQMPRSPGRRRACRLHPANAPDAARQKPCRDIVRRGGSTGLRESGEDRGSGKRRSAAGMGGIVVWMGAAGPAESIPSWKGVFPISCPASPPGPWLQRRDRYRPRC